MTFVSRNLEPLRGYHVFMRALPRILRARPNAHVVIVGNDQYAYGPAAPAGSTWKMKFLAEVADDIDLSRVHFVGPLPYHSYLKVLQISAAHVYLTYPFVPSWSLLEAMSAGGTVIASDCAPVREIVGEETGILVPFFDREGIASAVIAALAKPGACARFGSAARKHIVDTYDFKTVSLPRMREFLGQPVALSS